MAMKLQLKFNLPRGVSSLRAPGAVVLIAVTTALMVCRHGVVGASAPPPLPAWTGPFLDPLTPHGGQPFAANVTHTCLYRATPDIGTYNMAPMLTYHDGQFLASWKNSPVDEDQPGQRVLFSQSKDGVTWSGTNGSNILFPNMSTGANPAALFAEPALYINGRTYAAASPLQFCLYPCSYPAVLLLRRVFPGLDNFGPVFWASDVVPPGFDQATAEQGVLTVNQTDATTQADVATLSDPSSPLPCPPPSTGNLKCEAVEGGFLGAGSNMGQYEMCHYRRPGSTVDVLLYRSPVWVLDLHASVRATPGGPWYGQDGAQAGNKTNIPDDVSNVNCGTLPDGRNYLLSNAMPNVFRDPLWLSTSVDGVHFNATTPITSCDLPFYSAPDQPWGCSFRYQGGSKQSGCQYPQGMALVAPAPEGYWAIFSLNKEDIYVLRVPYESIP